MAMLQIELPDDILFLPSQTEETLRMLAREALLVRLYDQGIVTSGWAAQALGISRREFLDVLGRYSVSEFDEPMNVSAEALHASCSCYLQYKPADQVGWCRSA